MKIQIPEYANAAAKKTGGIGKGNALLYVEFCANYILCLAVKMVLISPIW